MFRGFFRRMLVSMYAAQQVVGRAHRVDVAGEVEVEVLHGDDLGVAAARRAALDAEDRAHAGLAQADDRVLADLVHRLGEADGGDRLALAQRRRGDGGDVDVLAVGLVLEAREDVEVDLRLVLAVQLEVVLLEPDLPGDVKNGLRVLPPGRYPGRSAPSSPPSLPRSDGIGGLPLRTKCFNFFFSPFLSL